MSDAYGMILEYVLSGNAVLFVGAGPSVEMGYPSWFRQVELLEEHVKGMGKTLPSEFYDYKSRGELPKAMESIERIIGRDELLIVLGHSLNATRPSEDSIYNTLVRWPFSLYLTTNFDDEIINHLIKVGRRDFVCLSNSEKDFAGLNEDAKDYVFKIHGELAKSSRAIITDSDYDSLIVNTDTKYYRDAINAVLKNRPIVVIGYSMKDPDIQYLLTRANSEGSIMRPICMLLCDVSSQEKEKFERLLLVKVVGYSNADRQHSDLKRVLGVLNSFIKPNTPITTHTEDSRHAASLYLFRTLKNGRRLQDVENHLLMLLPSPGKGSTSLEQLSRAAKLPRDVCTHVIEGLTKNRMIVRLDNGNYTRSVEGETEVEKCTDNFEITKKSAFDGFIRDFGTCLTSVESAEFARLADIAISELFSKRGMTLVRSLFGNGDVSSGELLDIYNSVASVAAGIKDAHKRLLFIQAIRQFVLKPSTHQKSYLVALSQGYFLYHLMGEDSIVRQLNTSFLSDAYWFVDSHILQSLIAIGCDSHQFTKSLFDILRDNKVKLCVTPGVIDEVLGHYNRACEDSPNVKGKDFYKRAVSLLHDKYNFFLDGYIRSSEKGVVKSFVQYQKMLSSSLAGNLRGLFSFYGIVEVSRKDWGAPQKRLYNELISEIDKIRRTKDKAIPLPKKVETEAELYVTVTRMEDSFAANNDNYNVYFLSHSTVFDRMPRKLKRWTDYSLYRFLLTLPDVHTHSVSLSDCLHSEFISAGLRLIDSDNYTRYFKEDIDAAKLEFEKERKVYIEEVEAESGLSEREFEERFNAIPDIEKPMFVNAMHIRMSDKAIRRAEAAMASKAETERENEKLRKENDILRQQMSKMKDDEEKEKRRRQVELSTLRNAKNPKHVAKRLRQAKKRAKNKRKGRK